MFSVTFYFFRVQCQEMVISCQTCIRRLHLLLQMVQFTPRELNEMSSKVKSLYAMCPPLHHESLCTMSTLNRVSTGVQPPPAEEPAVEFALTTLTNLTKHFVPPGQLKKKKKEGEINIVHLSVVLVLHVLL